MKKFKKYLLLLLVLFLAACNLNLILKPLDLVTGGTQGMAILFNHLLNISPAMIIFIINILALIISYFFLPKETTYGTVIATFFYPMLVKLTSNFNFFDCSSHPFLFAIIAGIISGITGGLVYKLGFSNGGISIVSLIFNKYFHISIALTNFIVNGIIVLLGLYYFGFWNFLLALLVIFLQSLLIKVVLDRDYFKKTIKKL